MLRVYLAAGEIRQMFGQAAVLKFTEVRLDKPPLFLPALADQCLDKDEQFWSHFSEKCRDEFIRIRECKSLVQI